MMRRRLSVLFLLAVLLPFSSLLSQRLSFAKIMQIYSADSAGASQLCQQYGLPLTKSGSTGSNKRYQYATPDSSHRLEIVYPNDSASLNTQLSYWFTGTGNFRTIEAGLRKAGFQRQSPKQTGSTLPANTARYVANALQAELIRPQGIQKSYWLFLHPVGEYSW